MKKFAIFLLIPIFLACGHAAKEKAKELQAKNDSLMNQTFQKDEAINDFIKSINDVQGILDTIKNKENIINVSTQKPGELKVSAKDQIKSDITTIYTLMLKNKHELSVLSRKLKASGMKVTELQKMVEHLQIEITAKNAELQTLRDKLAKLDIVVNTANLKIDTLTNVVENQGKQLNQQNQTIAEQEAALYTAYYVLGTSKELSKNGVIGRGDRILPDFNKTLFTKIDMRKTTEIPILTKKAKLVSAHPSTSYKLNMEGKMTKSIQILDFKSFWNNTKYLVVVLD
ncbi:MAG: hypothetical protein NTX61_15775 [Bacteroidetes bacterium]|nr:hypothetical protein [Bacteroidota bacterium]